MDKFERSVIFLSVVFLLLAALVRYIFVLGKQAKAGKAEAILAESETSELITASQPQMDKQERVDEYSKEPFGAALIRQVADKLLSRQDDGIIYGHRDYCGHGLVASSDEICLVDVSEGYPTTTLVKWPTKEAFVADFSQLSNYICSGASKEHAAFYTDSQWELDNQRIDRNRLENYISGTAGQWGF